MPSLLLCRLAVLSLEPRAGRTPLNAQPVLYCGWEPLTCTTTTTTTTSHSRPLHQAMAATILGKLAMNSASLVGFYFLKAAHRFCVSCAFRLISHCQPQLTYFLSVDVQPQPGRLLP